LYPNYVKNFKSYTCPSTQNYIRPDTTAKQTKPTEKGVIDLGWTAKDKTKNGLSYECFGNFTSRSHLKKTEQSVSTFSLEKYTGAPKGTIPGPSKIFLLVDGDDGNANKPGNPNGQYPDP